MKSNIKKCGENEWMFKIFGGKVNGKSIRRQQRGFSSKKEATLAANSVCDQLEKEISLITDSEPKASSSNVTAQNKVATLTLNQAYEGFITLEALNSRSYATIERYNSVYKNHFRKELGELQVTEFTSDILQSYLDDKSESYSNEFVKGIYNLMSLIFGYLQEKQYLLQNPIENVQSPTSYRKAEFEVYSSVMLGSLLDRLKTTSLVTPVMIGLHLGVRAGECYGLRWSDFDLKSRTVKINRQLQKQNSNWCFIPPKYSHCSRTVTFSKSFLKYLIQLKKRQDTIRETSPTTILPDIIVDRTGGKDKHEYVTDFLTTKDDGKMLNPNSNKVIARITANEMGYEFRYDNLRFTHAVCLAAAGCAPRFIKAHMGFGKLEQVYRLYDYIPENMESKSQTAIEAFYSSILGV